ncbi:MAG: competence protein ComEC [Saprospiraceae bacterium]
MITAVHTGQIPLAKMAVLLALGISIHRVAALDTVLSLSYAGLILICSVLIYYWVPFYWKTPILMFLILSTGFFISGIKESSFSNLRLSETLLSRALDIEIEVEEIRKYDKSRAIIGSITAVKREYRKSPRIILFGKNEDTDLKQLKRGSHISSRLKLAVIGNSENQKFEAYNSYLIDQGIIYRGFINQGQYEVSNIRKYPWWKYIRYDAREWALNTLDTYLDGESNAITKALLLGDKSDLNKETREKYAHSGIIHILAVSGLHVGFIVMFLLAIFRTVFFKLGPFSWTQVGFVSIALLAYVEISGGAPPVRRAVIMAILYLFAKALRKQFSPINILGFAAILLLCVAPNELFTVSFQLSFAAVGGIILFMPYFMSLCSYENRHVRKLWGIISIGIAAQISTFPITFYYFNQVPIFSAIAGVVAIPVAGFALCNGACILVFGSFSESIGFFLASLQSFLIYILNGVALLFSNISFSVWDNVTLLPIEAMLLIGAILAIAFFLNTKRSTALVFASFLILVQAGLHTSNVVFKNGEETIGLFSKQSEDRDRQRIVEMESNE